MEAEDVRDIQRINEGLDVAGAVLNGLLAELRGRRSPPRLRVLEDADDDADPSSLAAS